MAMKGNEEPSKKPAESGGKLAACLACSSTLKMEVICSPETSGSLRTILFLFTGVRTSDPAADYRALLPRRQYST
jgi:hypothetical protein